MKPKPTLYLRLTLCCLAMAATGHAQLLRSVPFHLYKTTQDTIALDRVGDLPFGDKGQFDKTRPEDIYWGRLDFSKYDSILSKDSWILQIGYLHKAEILYRTDAGIRSQILGAFQLNRDFSGQFPFDRDNLIDGQYLYLKFSISTVRSSLEGRTFTFYPEVLGAYLKKSVSKGYMADTNTTYLFLGGSLMGLIMAMMFYRTYRRPEYLYYILYVLGLCLYLGRSAWNFYGTHVGDYSKTSFLLNAILEMFPNIFYLLFVRHFLDTRTNYRLLDRIIGYAIIILAIFIITESASIAMGWYGWHLGLLDIRAIFLSALVVFAMVYLMKNRKSKLNQFIVGGSLLYGLGSILLYIFADGNYLKIGVLAEVFVFLLGLGYKIREENREKMQLQEESLENYRQLLRTQVNPHFIFNSLNSIQHLIIGNQRVAALTYLGKFGKLMRQTLEGSIERSILLSEEIKFLNTYLELESFRFDDSFNYGVYVDGGLCPDTLEIPQLMIQPFVENAILHGLLNKGEGDKALKVSFGKKENFLECTIEDNGIGRKASRKLNRFGTDKKSRGMELTQKRIKALFSNEIDRELLYIIDRTDSQGRPCGTTVVLNIPLQS